MGDVGERILRERVAELADGQVPAELTDLDVGPPRRPVGDRRHLVDGEFPTPERGRRRSGTRRPGRAIVTIWRARGADSPTRQRQEQLRRVHSRPAPGGFVGEHLDHEIDEPPVLSVEMAGDLVQVVFECPLPCCVDAHRRGHAEDDSTHIREMQGEIEHKFD